MPENTVIYNDYNWCIDYDGLALEIREWLEDNAFSAHELDVMIGHANVISPLLRAPGDRVYGRDNNLLMGTFLRICNICNFVPSNFFETVHANLVGEDGLKKGVGMSSAGGVDYIPF